MPYVVWQNITIQPYPNIQVTSDRTVQCDGSKIELQCCVQWSYEVTWSDPTTCGPTSGGHSHRFHVMRVSMNTNATEYVDQK